MPWRRTKQVLVAQSRGNLNETCWNVGILEHWNIGLKTGIGLFLNLN
jgi:hypothetical protein